MASLSFVMPTEVKPDIQMAIAEISEDKSIIPQKVASLENMNDTVVSEIAVERKLDEEKNIENAKYHLIVGTFRSISEAENYINTLSVNTDELKCLPTKTLVRVACASSDNLEELKSRLNSKSFKAEYKEAWIWSRYK